MPANILRGKTAGQDYKNYILSLMFYKRLCDQWENEADDAIAELEREQGRPLTERQKAVFSRRGEHRFNMPDGSRWGDVKTAATDIGRTLTQAMKAVADANEELRGVFTVDWNFGAALCNRLPIGSPASMLRSRLSVLIRCCRILCLFPLPRTQISFGADRIGRQVVAWRYK